MDARLPLIDACTFISPWALRQGDWMSRIPFLPYLDEGVSKACNQIAQKIHWYPNLPLRARRTTDLMIAMDQGSIDWSFIVTENSPKAIDRLLQLTSRVSRLKPVLRVALPKGKATPTSENTKDWVQGLKKRGFRGLMCPLSIFFNISNGGFYRDMLHHASLLKMPLFITTDDVKHIDQKEREAFQTWMDSFPRVQFVVCSQKRRPWAPLIRLLGQAPNVFLSTAGASYSELMQGSSVLGPSRLIFASHWPLQTPLEALQDLKRAARAFSPDWLQQVLSLNAMKLLP